MSDYLGTILSIDQDFTKTKEDAFSLDLDKEGNYWLNVYIADPITNNDKNIKQIINETMDFDSSYKEVFLKRNLKNSSLSEEEKQPVFCFTFKISKEGETLDFKFSKKEISIDIEMTETEVVEVIEDESSLFDYLLEINNLSEVLYKKMTGGKEFYSYGQKARFDFLFPGQFLTLLNNTLTKKMMSLNLPLIYSVKTSNEQINNMVEPNYFTSVPTKNKFGLYYARFATPLREIETLINLSVFNDLVFYQTDKQTYDRNLAYYEKIIDGYVSIDNKIEQGRRFK